MLPETSGHTHSTFPRRTHQEGYKKVSVLQYYAPLTRNMLTPLCIIVWFRSEHRGFTDVLLALMRLQSPCGGAQGSSGAEQHPHGVRLVVLRNSTSHRGAL